jgi:ParB/RepB/Spo0J family partition protein
MSEIEIPDTVMLKREEIRPNKWNPNEFDADTFNELVKSIEDFGIVQPLIVGPLEGDPEGFKFEVIDGEHRWTALDILEVPVIPCIVKDIDEDQRQFLTVRTYRIRGKFNMKSFTKMVEGMMEKYSFDEVAEQMAFTDPDELQEMISAARTTITDPDMRKEFDKAKDEIQTVDDLTNILNRLFTRFGDSLPANFMLIEFGGKNHLWVRMRKGDFPKIREQARNVMAEGVTFDSFLSHLVSTVPVTKWVEKHRDLLEAIPEESREEANIDNLLKEEA